MQTVRFGTFVFETAAGELSRGGHPVAVQQQPLQVLRVLLEQPGELVTRETLHRRLWPGGITVEFDQSLNKSVTKLRDALGDSAINPRFIETLPKRGYRFIAPVTTKAETAASSAVISPLDSVAGTPQRPWDAARPSAIRWWWIGALAAAAVALPVALPNLLPDTGALAREAAPRARPLDQSPAHAAKDAFERGRLALSRRTPQALLSASDLFERAVGIGPRFADAYVGLADAWSHRSSYGLLDPREAMPRAREAANRALAIKPSLAAAHASLGRIATIFDWDWIASEWHFVKALQLDSGNATAHEGYSYLFSARGRHDDAVAAAWRAVASDPLSLNSNTALGFVLYLARRFDEAAVHLERALDSDPDFAQARRNLAFVRVQQGRLDEAIVALKRVAAITDDAPTATAELAWVEALAGDHTAARTTLLELDRMRASTFIPPDAIALVYSALGAQDEALAWLQRAFTMRAASLAHLPVDPMWDGLRDHPRVREMIAVIRRD